MYLFKEDFSKKQSASIGSMWYKRNNKWCYDLLRLSPANISNYETIIQKGNY
jgi:hypothetical protein